MKKPVFFGLFTLTLLFLLPDSIQAQNRRYNRYASSTPEQRFTAGLAPLSLITPSGKVNVHAEWAYADNKSVSLIIGVPRNTKMPDWLSNDLVLEDQGQTTSNVYHSFGVSAENRFYLARNAPRGFYLAPYLRYNRIWLDHTTEKPESAGETSITGALGGFGGGGAVGWQFGLGEHITLDATFIGIDFKYMRGTLTYASTDPNNDIFAFRDQVAEKVADIPIIGKRLTPAIDGDKVKVHTPGWLLPAYRFNLSVNYAF